MTDDEPVRPWERFVVGRDVLVPAELAGGLLEQLRPLVRMLRARPPAQVTNLMTALAVVDRDLSVSRTRSREGPGEMLVEQVRWVTAREAADDVGCTPERVQQLCRAGAVRHRRIGQRMYLVDLEDLHRHYRKETR
jgi:hypothetical protein